MSLPTSPTTPSRTWTARRVVLLSALLIVVLLGGALAIWLTMDVDAEPAVLPTPSPLPESRLYNVDPAQSALRFTADSVAGKVSGTYDMAGGTIELDDAGSGERHVLVTLALDARSLNIGSTAVNTLMRRALQVDRYPVGQFIARSASPLPSLDAPHTVDLVGQLELHGTVQDYTIPTTVTVSGDMITLAAELVINAEIFGVDLSAIIDNNELNADLAVVGTLADRSAPAPDATPAATPGS